MALAPEGVDFIAIALFRAPFEEVVRGLDEWSVWTDGMGLERGEPPASPIVPEPQPYSARPQVIRLWEPRSNPGTTAFYANFQDGWLGVAETVAERETFEVVTLRAGVGHWSPPEPAARLVVKNGATLLRLLDVARYEAGWSFTSLGEPLAFERVERYEARRRRDRFDCALLTEYVAALGWDLGDPAFWEHDGLSARCSHDWPDP